MMANLQPRLNTTQLIANQINHALERQPGYEFLKAFHFVAQYHLSKELYADLVQETKKFMHVEQIADADLIPESLRIKEIVVSWKRKRTARHDSSGPNEQALLTHGEDIAVTTYEASAAVRNQT
jgi:hypothetical protein